MRVAHVVSSIACVVLLSSAASSAQAPQFEVASIRPSAGQDLSSGVGFHIDGSQVRVTNLSLKLYIGTAFSVRPQQIVGPDWLGQPRFDVSAKIPDGATPEQVPAMLQTLLADRFQMKSHHETREFAVFALTIGKDGFTLPPATADAAAAGDTSGVTVTAGANARGSGADLGRGASFTLADNHVEIHRMSLQSIADLLTRLSDRPVIDATSMKGLFDITLDLPPEDFIGVQIRAALNNGVILPPQALRLLDNAASDSFSNALHKVGLTLESRKSPLDVLVVDSIEKTPTEN